MLIYQIEDIVYVKKTFTLHELTVVKNLNCGIKQTNFETSYERI